MSIEENKAVIRQFLKAFNAGDYDAAFALVAPDAQWQNLDGGLEPSRLTKTEVMGRLKGAKALFSIPVAWNPVTMTAEEDRVAVEIDGHGVTRGGFVYQNRYMNLFVIRDGSIMQMTELAQARPISELMAAIASENAS